MSDKITKLFSEFMGSTAKQKATEVIEGPSPANPNRVNVFVQAGNFDACQAIVAGIMEREGTATFTIPELAANGQWVAFGHYPKHDELPEL